MILTKAEKRTVLAVFQELEKRKDLNTFLGSVTIREMQELCRKLEHEEYCESHGVAYEDMSEDDFVNAALEKISGTARNTIIDPLRRELPPVQVEPLTDSEQRIFLAAMGREEKICKQVDEECSNLTGYEDSLVRVCKEIVRKVKNTLWDH